MTQTVAGQKIEQARLARGWTLARLGQECGLLPQTIHAIETGASKEPKRRTLAPIAKALDLPLEELWVDTLTVATAAT